MCYFSYIPISVTITGAVFRCVSIISTYPDHSVNRQWVTLEYGSDNKHLSEPPEAVKLSGGADKVLVGTPIHMLSICKASFSFANLFVYSI